MQDEVNEKTIALYIKTGKLTAQTLQKAMKAILSKGKKQLSKPPQGKQSLKQLMKQNAGVSNIEITEGNIKAFEQTLVVALGAGLGIWGVINLMEGYGNDNPGAKSQGMKQLMAGGGVALIGMTLVPLLSGLFG